MMNTLTLSQIVSQPVVYTSFATSFASLLAFFFICVRSGLAKTERQISWLLTFASSLVCTAASLPYFFRFALSGWEIKLLSHDAEIHTALVCFFISYLVLDLSLGSIYYKARITILTGWLHHSLYIVILTWLMHRRTTAFFTTNSLLELPTLILAVGSLKQRWRCDFLFASTFFALRLVFHAWMIAALKQHHRVESLWMVAVLVFPLHAYWFKGIMRQLIRRYTKSFKFPSTKTITTKRSKHSFLDKIYAI